METPMDLEKDYSMDCSSEEEKVNPREAKMDWKNAELKGYPTEVNLDWTKAYYCSLKETPMDEMTDRKKD